MDLLNILKTKGPNQIGTTQLRKRKIMKKIIATMSFVILFSVFTIGTYGTSAFAETESDYLFSSKSNNTWLLKKSTRKLILVNFEKADHIWKSNVIMIPDEFNLNECTITAVGIRGTSVFLLDKSSGFVTLFSAGDDGSIKTYLVGDLKEDLN
jgi:hypothetical protein